MSEFTSSTDEVEVVTLDREVSALTKAELVVLKLASVVAIWILPPHACLFEFRI